jgi:hypothetical protein
MDLYLPLALIDLKKCTLPLLGADRHFPILLPSFGGYVVGHVSCQSAACVVLLQLSIQIATLSELMGQPLAARQANQSAASLAAES